MAGVMTERVRVDVWKSAELDSGNIVDSLVLSSIALLNALPVIESRQPMVRAVNSTELGAPAMKRRS